MRTPRAKHKIATLDALRRHWNMLTNAEQATVEQYGRIAAKRDKYHNQGDRHAGTA